jgi:hypothetical protein
VTYLPSSLSFKGRKESICNIPNVRLISVLPKKLGFPSIGSQGLKRQPDVFTISIISNMDEMDS